MNQPEVFFLKLPIKENKCNVCDCSYVRAYPQVIFERCLVQKKCVLVMMLLDLWCSKWISVCCFTLERKTLRIHVPNTKIACWKRR